MDLKILTDFNGKSGLRNFTISCLLNESIYCYKGSIQIIKEYWEKAKDVKEFSNMVLSDERLKENQGYWELAKEQDYYTYNNLLNKYLMQKCDKHFNTISDIGSIKIGNNNFTFNIPNNYGDGENDIYIFNQNVHLQGLDFLTTCNGEFNIYKYDCGDNISCTLKGKYAIYVGELKIAFVKWD